MKWSALKLALISIISLLQLVLILFFLSYKNLNSFLGSWSDNSSLTIYLKADASENEKNQLVDFLKKQKSTREVIFISRQQAVKEFQKSIGPYSAGLLAEDELIDLIPETVELYTQSDLSGATKISFFESIKAQISAFNFIEEVIFGSNWLKRFSSVDQFFQLFGFFCFLVILLAIGLLSALMVRVLIEDSKSEIEVFNLLGATSWSIYKLFLKDIFISLAISIVISLSLSYLIFSIFENAFTTSDFGKHLSNSFNFLNFNETSVFIFSILIFIGLSSLSSVSASLQKLSQNTYD